MDTITTSILTLRNQLGLITIFKRITTGISLTQRKKQDNQFKQRIKLQT